MRKERIQITVANVFFFSLYTHTQRYKRNIRKKHSVDENRNLLHITFATLY